MFNVNVPVTVVSRGMDNVVVDTPPVNANVPLIVVSAGNEYVVSKLHALSVTLLPIVANDDTLNVDNRLVAFSVNVLVTDVNSGALNVVVFNPPVNANAPDMLVRDGKLYDTKASHPKSVNPPVFVIVARFGTDRVLIIVDALSVNPPHVVSKGNENDVTSDPAVISVINPVVDARFGTDSVVVDVPATNDRTPTILVSDAKLYDVIALH